VTVGHFEVKESITYFIHNSRHRALFLFSNVRVPPKMTMVWEIYFFAGIAREGSIPDPVSLHDLKLHNTVGFWRKIQTVN